MRPPLWTHERESTTASTVERPSPRATTSFRRVLAGSMAGSALEWYDFAIYGVLAATVLGRCSSPTTAESSVIGYLVFTMAIIVVAVATSRETKAAELDRVG